MWTHAQLLKYLDPVHANPFWNENGAVLLRFQRVCVHTYRFRIVFARPHYNADQERSHRVASVRHFRYSRSNGLVPSRVYFDDVTIFRFQISVSKKHCFQIAELWRAFLNGSVFSDRFRHCNVADSRIRNKTGAFSFWTGPDMVTSLSLLCKF